MTSSKYREAIRQLQEGLGSSAKLRGLCKDFSERLIEQFPELKLVRGHYHCPYLKKPDPHWWCETPEGSVVDATAEQYLSFGMGHYEPWPEEKSLPTGKCPNCSAYTYHYATCCSTECHNEYGEYLMRSIS